MSAERRIVVEALVPAPVELVWLRSQDPVQHVRWDIRFTTIAYLDERDERGFQLMDYRTDLAFGIEVKGQGRYLHSTPLARSTFEFDSADWRSLIRDGRGIWLYESRPEGTFFKTVYDYETRHGWVGALFDRLLFRSLFQLATEWSFETLRLWCAGDDGAPARRRSRAAFLRFFLGRRLGRSPEPGAARSWLGRGTEESSGDQEEMPAVSR